MEVFIEDLLFFERLIMRKKILPSFLIITLFLILSACNNKQLPTSDISAGSTGIETESNPSSVETAYPIPQENEGYVGTSYPAGQEPTLDFSNQIVGTIEPNIVPDSDPDYASMYGVLNSFTDKEPLQGVMIYAADVIIVDSSGDKIYTTQEKSSPHDATDGIGQFTLVEIKPGNYLLMMVTPFGNYPIFDENNIQVEIELKAGDVVNLDKVFVNWP